MQRREPATRARQYLRAAPRNAVEKPARYASQPDQGVATVLGGCQHRIGARAQRARGGAQVRGPECRAVAADEHRIRMIAQLLQESAVHAIADIAPALGAKRNLEALLKLLEKDVSDPGRTIQNDAAESGIKRGANGSLYQARVQSGGAIFAQQGHEARLHAPRCGSPREDDQRGVRPCCRSAAQARRRPHRGNIPGANATSRTWCAGRPARSSGAPRSPPLRAGRQAAIAASSLC